jgi:plasmid stability protein
MTQVLIRNLDVETVARLRERARTRGRSLEAELRMILARAAQEPLEEPEHPRAHYRDLVSRLRAALGPAPQPDSTESLREDRVR